MRPLTARQREVLDLLVRYYRLTGEPIALRLLARRLHRHHSTVQAHLEALCRKGWLPAPAAPRLRPQI